MCTSSNVVELIRINFRQCCFYGPKGRPIKLGGPEDSLPNFDVVKRTSVYDSELIHILYLVMLSPNKICMVHVDVICGLFKLLLRPIQVNISIY